MYVRPVSMLLLASTVCLVILPLVLFAVMVTISTMATVTLVLVSVEFALLLACAHSSTTPMDSPSLS